MRYTLFRFFSEGKGLFLLNLAAVVTLGWAVSLWVGRFISPPAQMKYTPPNVYKVTSGGPMADYSAVTRRNIFNPDQTGGPIGQTTGGIIPCTLPLKLSGTILSEDSSENIAIIETTQDRQQDLYYIGSRVMGAMIVKIEKFEVILNNNGQMERLSIDFGVENQEIASVPAGRGATKRGGPPVTSLGGKMVMDRAYFDAQKSNTSDLMTQVRAIPNTGADGKINGFQLFEIAKDSIYDRVGLKNQDIIQRVNGQSLNSVESGLDLFNALKNDTHFTVDIQRNKENKTIKVDIQ